VALKEGGDRGGKKLESRKDEEKSALKAIRRRIECDGW